MESCLNHDWLSQESSSLFAFNFFIDYDICEAAWILRMSPTLGGVNVAQALFGHTSVTFSVLAWP